MNAPSRIRPATRGDGPEIVDLLNACDVAETGEPDSSIEDLENDWTMEGFDIARDAWVAESAAGELVGYAYAGDQFRTGELEADLWVHPAHHEPSPSAAPRNSPWNVATRTRRWTSSASPGPTPSATSSTGTATR
jgi:hypothetical protein